MERVRKGSRGGGLGREAEVERVRKGSRGGGGGWDRGGEG